MRILLLCHSFNSLRQRLHVALGSAGHEVSVEFDIHPAVTEEAVRLFAPDLPVRRQQASLGVTIAAAGLERRTLAQRARTQIVDALLAEGDVRQPAQQVARR